MEKQPYCYTYPRPAVTTDCVLFDTDGASLSVLLIQRKQYPHKGAWAFPGGFLEMEETVEEGALRELKEETRLENIAIEQLQVFSAVDRDPRGRVITVAFYGIVNKSKLRVQAGDDAARAQWFSINQLPPLAFDHAAILQVALERVKEKKSV